MVVIQCLRKIENNVRRRKSLGPAENVRHHDTIVDEYGVAERSIGTRLTRAELSDFTGTEMRLHKGNRIAEQHSSTAPRGCNMGSLRSQPSTPPGLNITGLAGKYPSFHLSPESLESFAKQCYDVDTLA